MSGEASSPMIHSARPLTISRSSFASKGGNGADAVSSGERKKNLLQMRRRQLGLGAQLVESAAGTDASGRQQHEAVADTLGVRELMDGENQGAPATGLVAKHAHDVAGLTKIEAVEGLIHHDQLMRRQ